MTIEDLGEKLGGARKDAAMGEGSELTGVRPTRDRLDDVWPAPVSWADVAASVSPKRAALLMVLRGNVAKNPHPSGTRGMSGEFWARWYDLGLMAVQAVVKSEMVEPNIDSLSAAYTDKLLNELGNAASEQERHFVRFACGRLSKRTLKTPFLLTPIARARAEYLAEWGWGINPNIPDDLAFCPIELRDRTTGRTFWWAAIANSSGWEKAVEQEFQSHEDALAALKDHVARHIAERAAQGQGQGQGKRRKQQVWRRPSLGDLPIREAPADDPNSQSADPLRLISDFQYRGVEWGNWVPQGERQALVDAAIDSARDLSRVLGMSPSVASLGGRLGIAFGSRGVGLSQAAAHFEPTNWVMHHTRKSGAGAMAHEFGHALDRYLFTRTIGREHGISGYLFASQISRWTDKVRPRDHEIWRAMRDFSAFTLSSEWARRSRGVDLDSSKRAADYWGSPEELFARAFETFIAERLAIQGIHNRYLVHGVLPQELGEYGERVYPTGSERSTVIALLQEIVNQCRIAWSQNSDAPQGQ